eukprot:1319646-Amorphochlora_amoeboformis.AAC.1
MIGSNRPMTPYPGRGFRNLPGEGVEEQMHTQNGTSSNHVRKQQMHTQNGVSSHRVREQQINATNAHGKCSLAL